MNRPDATLYWDAAGGVVPAGWSISSGTNRLTTHRGVACWDLNDDQFSASSGAVSGPIGASYTHVYWVWWKEVTTSWRTGFRSSPDDHCVIVRSSDGQLGVYDNNGNHGTAGWVGCGATLVTGEWRFVATVGAAGTTTYYTGSAVSGVTQTCTALASCAGNTQQSLSLSSQGMGYVGQVWAFDSRAMSLSELNGLYTASSGRYRTALLAELNAAATLYWDAAGGVVPAGWSISSGTNRLTTHRGVACWDLNDDQFSASSGAVSGPIGASYTHVYWVWWKEVTTSWRTGFRSSPDDHCVIVRSSDGQLGVYDNNGNHGTAGWVGCGATLVTGEWRFVATVGAAGTTTYYTGSAVSGVTQTCTALASCAGNTQQSLSLSSQGMGYVGQVWAFDSRAMSLSELNGLYEATKATYQAASQ